MISNTQQQTSIDYEDELRKTGLVPIRQLGKGAFGCIYLAFGVDHGLVAAKIFQSGKFDQNEADSAFSLQKEKGNNIFVLNYKIIKYGISNRTIVMTLEAIVKQPQIKLPTYALRALMKQILEGIRFIHSAGFVHRDIKLDNMLLHSPPGSGKVYCKISDFGFTKKEDTAHGMTYMKGGKKSLRRTF
ncbi:MAG: hypothetical protein EZS28_034514 [Streblomastix strix]|uniref:Protein kinase domain-containing protein n=1 Tax=Streblomastix strix TaxID=222440 RepID=A0A5J4UHE4_9EUKA|nr:MAG: hypothetical protein EZS28_034514 [Streblomastix strix]